MWGQRDRKGALGSSVIRALTPSRGPHPHTFCSLLLQREGGRGGNADVWEAWVGCLPDVPRLGIEPATFWLQDDTCLLSRTGRGGSCFSMKSEINAF